jgi:hypothetical protein
MIPVQLAVNIGDEFKLKGNQGIGSASSPYQTIGGFISVILPNVYIVASLILFVLLVGGGFAIMMAGDDPQQKGKGAKAFGSAIAGFIEFLTGISIFKPSI